MISKISLGINILLIIAVGYLFFNLPSQKKNNSENLSELPVASAFSDTAAVKAPILAYVNGDTLNARFKFIKEKSAALESKMKSAEDRLRNEMSKREAEWEQNVNYAKNNKLTGEEEALIQQTLEKLQSEIEEIRQQESENLMKREEELQKELQSRVEEFLDRYAIEKGIDFIINYQQNVNIVLHGNPAYDITNDVVARLNAEYEQEKAEKK